MLGGGDVVSDPVVLLMFGFGLGLGSMLVGAVGRVAAALEKLASAQARIADVQERDRAERLRRWDQPGVTGARHSLWYGSTGVTGPTGPTRPNTW